MTALAPVARRRMTSTPGAAGYLLAVLVSIAVADLLLVLTTVPFVDVGRLLAGLFVTLVYVTIFAIPTAPVGVLLVHLCCRRVQPQWVHVLAAGGAGVLTGLAFGAWAAGVTEIFSATALAAILGVATAIGRACVIPLVPGEDRR